MKFTPNLVYGWKQVGLFFTLVFMFAACEMIDYHPYDAKVRGEKHVNAHNIEEIEKLCLNKETIRFAAISDSQRWYDETDDFVKHINSRSDVDFVIHTGDMSDFGITDEFLLQRDMLNELHVPYVVIIGNHDNVGSGRETYKTVFGEVNFSFIAGRTKFVCLDTNSWENDYFEDIPNFGFIKKELKSRTEEYDKSVVCMHVRPLADEFNNNVADLFHYYTKQFPRLQFCLAGHEHRLSETEPFEDGVKYYLNTCINDRVYYLFTLTPDGYSYEKIYF